MAAPDVMPWHRKLLGELLARRASLPHALLLYGRRGIGKLQFASTLAQSLLCEAPRADGSCGACVSCNWFQSHSHPDFRLLEPAAESAGEEEETSRKPSTQIVIEQVRELTPYLNVPTHRGGLKLVLLHPAEAMNPNAANALLKNLEEPSAGTVFLLVTHRIHQLLPTIKSRCQLVPMPGPQRDEAVAWLKGKGVQNAELAAAHSGDSPLVAAQEGAEAYWSARKRFLDCLSSPQFDALSAAEQCQDCELPQLLEWMQKWTYDLAALKLSGKLRYNPDYEAALSRLAAQASTLSALRFHREMVRLQRHAHHPLNVRLWLEQTLIAYAALTMPRRAAA